MQSKIIRSVLSNKKSIIHKFIPLIKIENDIIKIQNTGLQVIKKLTNGPLIIVAFQSQSTQIPQTMFQCTQPNLSTHSSGIWISENFIQDDQFGSKLVALVSFSKTIQQFNKIHLINSIISSIVVVNIYPDHSNFKFLKNIQNYIKNYQNSNLNQQLANIIILERPFINGSSKEINLINDRNKLQTIYTQNNIDGMSSLYRSINYFKLPADGDLKYNKTVLEDLEFKFIQIYLLFAKESKKLEYGPVLAEFLPLIVLQFNQKSLINFIECLNKIQIDESYEAYMQGLEYYNQCIRRKFKSNQPINNPEIDLNEFKQEAIQEYKNKTKDLQHLMDLNNTIEEKQIKILIINDTMWKQRNIEILKKQSKGLLKYAQYKDDPSFDVKKQTQRIIKNYNRNAGGRTKQQDLNGFLQKLNETLGEDNYNKTIKISRLERDNKRLEDRLKLLQKKGCCSGCQIM